MRPGWGEGAVTPTTRCGPQMLPYQMSSCATAIWCWDSASEEYIYIYNWWKDMAEIVSES